MNAERERKSPLERIRDIERRLDAQDAYMAARQSTQDNQTSVQTIANRCDSFIDNEQCVRPMGHAGEHRTYDH